MISAEISRYLAHRIEVGDFPSAVYLVAEKGEIVFQDALGFAVVEPEMIEAGVGTIYDVASLTKPLVTGLLCAKLIETGELDLDRAIDFYLPNSFQISAGAGTVGELTIRQILAHNSGLPSWKPFYLIVNDRHDILREILKTPRNPVPDVTYSDLNFLLLTFLLEELRGEPLDISARHEIVKPLGLTHTCFNPPRNMQHQIAASEKGNDYEKRTCIESGYLRIQATEDGAGRFRDYQIWGEVHDGNAWFMGGIAGHAGLFSTAREIFKISLEFLPDFTTLFTPETCKLFRSNLTPGLNENRSLAFQLASTPESTAGCEMSPESFGHLGFTGTSLWIDPFKQRSFILLTNRTHAHPLPFANINGVRRRFHDLASEQLDKLN